MKIVGIIAEYNPFHEGHAYQIARAKALSGADYCIVVMSGYFVQRGEPAVYDPFKRAKSALDAGADAVFAMPALFSCASAEIFAEYGVGLLNDLGCDAVSFGVESWDAELFAKASDILSAEPERFRTVLKTRLKAGDSFAAARMEAVGACLGSEIPSMDQPNQILALEYLRALKKLNSRMQIIPVVRVGHGYHDETLDDTKVCGMSKADYRCNEKRDNVRSDMTDCQENDVEDAASAKSAASYPSATALRKKLRETGTDGCIFSEDIWPMLLSVIMRKVRDGEDLTQYADVSPEIANRIVSLIGRPCCGNFGSFTSELKTKQYAYTRIARSLMHIFLDHKDRDICKARDAGRYALLLGFRRDSRGLLKEFKCRNRVPVISKVADAAEVIRKFYAKPEEGLDVTKDAGETACESENVTNGCDVQECLSRTQILQHIFESDVYASRLYATAYMCKYGRLLPDLYTSRLEVSPNMTRM